jgi:hypothetical protein
VYLPGVASNYLSVPDENALDITGDIDIRARVSFDNWAPGSQIAIVAKYAFGGNFDAYALSLTATGGLRLQWQPASLVNQSAISSTVTGFAAGVTKWVRATLQVNNGAGGNAATFYTSDDGATWTQLGTVITGSGTTDIQNGTTALGFGAGSNGSVAMSGKIYRAQVLNGINGTTVLDINCDAITSGNQTSFLASTGQTVSINRATSGRKSVAMPSKLLKKSDDANIYMPGVALNYLSVPDEAALRITGDIDVRVWVSLDQYRGANVNELLSKNGGAGNRGWIFRLDATTGFLRFQCSADGTAQINAVSTAALTIGDGMPVWLRATLKVDNGASGNDVNFYTSSDGSTWTQLGSTVTTAGTTSIYSSTAGVLDQGSSSYKAGRIYRAQVFNGINGTKVLDIDTSVANKNWIPGQPGNFLATTGQTVTLFSTANSGMRVNNTKYEAGKSIMLLGTDDYLEVQGTLQHQLLNFNQNDSFTLFVVGRIWNNTGGVMTKTATLAAYYQGYIMNLGIPQSSVNCSDGTSYFAGAATQSSQATGILRSLCYVRQTTGLRNARFSANGVVGTITYDTGGREDSRNTQKFRMGAAAGGGYVFDGEIYSAAVFRRALTTREINIISKYYGTAWS